MTGVTLSNPWARILVTPAALLLLALLVGPSLFLLSYSFAPGGSMTADFSAGPTAENYASVLADTFYLGIILKTVLVSILVTVASVLIGWPLAFFIWSVPLRWKGLATLAVVAPLLISIPVRNYGWMVILGDSGVLNLALLKFGIVSAPLKLMFTDFAAGVGLTHVLMPFVVLSVLATLERIPPSLAEAAQTMGAPRLRAIIEIILPLSMPGILAGGVLVFCVAVSSYVTPALMGPSGAKYAATLIYQQFVSLFDWPRGAAIAAILLVVTAVPLVFVLGLFNRRGRRAAGAV